MRHLIAALLACIISTGSTAQESNDHPVAHVATHYVTIPYPGGNARLPVYLSDDWNGRLPGITRAIILIHGLHRNANDDHATMLRAQKLAGVAALTTIMVTPQFLAEEDIAPHHLPPEVLAWPRDKWARGGPAVRPAPISSFSVLDTLIVRLADATLFPDMRTIILAGFSAGGQIVQRYAVVGEAEDTLRPGVTVSYVVSDPSSYLYFSPDRPKPLIAAACPAYQDWHYGFGAGKPPYVTRSTAAYESRYINRDVTYLLGLADTDPNHPVLDKSCAAEAQGLQRLSRGDFYWSDLRNRHGEALRHTLYAVPDIAHEGERMFTSECGLHVLFGIPGCGE